jgi:hypothetical protein
VTPNDDVQLANTPYVRSLRKHQESPPREVNTDHSLRALSLTTSFLSSLDLVHRDGKRFVVDGWKPSNEVEGFEITALCRSAVLLDLSSTFG